MKENHKPLVNGAPAGAVPGVHWWPRVRPVLWKLMAVALIYSAVMQFASVVVVGHGRLQKPWPVDCIGLVEVRSNATADNLSVVKEAGRSTPSPPALLPQRDYKSNGYLLLSCNGGLNQMRAAICDMVTVARYLNLTLVVPELDKRSFWSDASDFEDIFDADYFINSLRDEVRIVKKLPEKFQDKNITSMPPVSWSSEKYYLETILLLVRKHKVLRFEKTDTRLANNNLPLEIQKLRCRVNYNSLKFTPQIESLGKKLISILRKSGFFVALHLRYEMDMLSFSGCSHGCSDEETEELTRMRYQVPWWKEKEIVSENKRMEGRCPLTPEETALVLKALGFERNTRIYIAAGSTYGGARRLAALRDVFPNTVDKDMLLSSSELGPLRNHSSQMAGLDYLVSLASDVFIPTYDGNMARLVEGHRRYNGFHKSIILDRRELVEILDLYQNGKLSWDQFSHAVQDAHRDRMGQPKVRNVIPGLPKEEDYFYANPQECLGPPTDQSATSLDI